MPARARRRTQTGVITFDMENWMRVREATPDDFDDWLELAREVEPLFGPMVDDAAFREGLKRAIEEKIAWCVEEPDEQGRTVFRGGIVVSREANEILWLAVSGRKRGHGMGASLLSEAIGRLDRSRPISVTTFDDTIPEGLPARRLYRRVGFEDSAAAGLNPAGIPTVMMILGERGAREREECPPFSRAEKQQEGRGTSLSRDRTGPGTERTIKEEPL